METTDDQASEEYQKSEPNAGMWVAAGPIKTGTAIGIRCGKHVQIRLYVCECMESGMDVNRTILVDTNVTVHLFFFIPMQV